MYLVSSVVSIYLSSPLSKNHIPFFTTQFPNQQYLISSNFLSPHSMEDTSIIKIGPVGSDNGDNWDENGRVKVAQIFISHDDEIKSIQFQYADNGALVLSDCYGPRSGYKFDAVKLNYPSEYITWISGYKSYNTGNLTSLTIGTSQGQYGPFGQFANYDKEFCFRLGEDRQFGGFHGTADANSLKSIGLHLKPIVILDSLQKNGKRAKLAKEDESWEMLDH